MGGVKEHEREKGSDGISVGRREGWRETAEKSCILLVLKLRSQSMQIPPRHVLLLLLWLYIYLPSSPLPLCACLASARSASLYLGLLAHRS